MAIVNHARLEKVDELLGSLAIVVRMARVDGDRDTLQYVSDRLEQMASDIRAAQDKLSHHPPRKR